ncbi:MAG: hypothetical protein NWQ46_06990, partial [Spirosomaceae bacterium]|nr:hypothetical protein [Spirosomataceae bacterium]
MRGGQSIFFLFCTISLIAQKPVPPIPFELFVGHDALFVQNVVKRSFTEESRFSLFNLATYNHRFQTNNEENDMDVVSQFNYELFKGFGLMAGAEMNSAVGFSPIVGVEHSFASRKWLAVTIFSYFTNDKNDASLFGLYEFKPSLNNNVALYSRAQFMLNRSLSTGAHNRSFIQIRLGLKQKQLRYGLAANLDRYGP